MRLSADPTRPLPSRRKRHPRPPAPSWGSVLLRTTQRNPPVRGGSRRRIRRGPAHRPRDEGQQRAEARHPEDFGVEGDEKAGEKFPVTDAGNPDVLGLDERREEGLTESATISMRQQTSTERLPTTRTRCRCSSPNSDSRSSSGSSRQNTRTGRRFSTNRRRPGFDCGHRRSRSHERCPTPAPLRRTFTRDTGHKPR